MYSKLILLVGLIWNDISLNLWTKNSCFFLGQHLTAWYSLAGDEESQPLEEVSPVPLPPTVPAQVPASSASPAVPPLPPMMDVQVTPEPKGQGSRKLSESA